jgi:hypothetical protein
MMTSDDAKKLLEKIYDTEKAAGRLTESPLLSAGNRVALDALEQSEAAKKRADLVATAQVAFMRRLEKIEKELFPEAAAPAETKPSAPAAAKPTSAKNGKDKESPGWSGKPDETPPTDAEIEAAKVKAAADQAAEKAKAPPAAKGRLIPPRPADMPKNEA